MFSYILFLDYLYRCKIKYNQYGKRKLRNQDQERL